MNQARSDATATLLNNGKVLIAGGLDSNHPLPINSVELYDPSSNSFAPAASLPSMNTARSSATATLLFSGKVLIAGGVGPSFNSLDNVELYDPSTNSFAPAASLPTMNTARDGAIAALLPNGEVLIAGGENNATSLKSVELYNPTTNSFAPPASTPTMHDLRAFPTATSPLNGKVLIAGGLVGSTVGIQFISNSVDLYDPATNSFASGPTMLASRYSGEAALLLNGNVLIAGGIGHGPLPPFQVSLRAVDLYDPAGNSFAPAASTPLMNQARESATATTLNNGKVLIAGGLLIAVESGKVDESILATVDLYDPATNSFAPATSTPTMNNGRAGATATLLPNGKVIIAGGLIAGGLIAGGQGVFGPTNSVELYTQ
jgi:N-acetylneuraminic acid mutarotase